MVNATVQGKRPNFKGIKWSNFIAVFCRVPLNFLKVSTVTISFPLQIFPSWRKFFVLLKYPSFLAFLRQQRSHGVCIEGVHPNVLPLSLFKVLGRKDIPKSENEVSWMEAIFFSSLKL